MHTGQGLVLIDWERYHLGDCAEDVAFFVERNFLLKEEHHGALEGIIEAYRADDPSFPPRLSFHLAMCKLWHLVIRGTAEQIPPGIDPQVLTDEVPPASSSVRGDYP